MRAVLRLLWADRWTGAADALGVCEPMALYVPPMATSFARQHSEEAH